MPKVGSFVHTITHDVAIAATNAYSTTRRHNLDLTSDTNPGETIPFRGRLDSINIVLDTIAGGATTLTVRLTRDLAGDDIAFGDTTATISTGVTTATAGSVTIKFDALYGYSSDSLYLFWKTNVGTANVDKITVNWME